MDRVCKFDLWYEKEESSAHVFLAAPSVGLSEYSSRSAKALVCWVSPPTPGKRQGMEPRTPGWMSASQHSCHPPPVHALILGTIHLGHAFTYSFSHPFIRLSTHSLIQP